MSRKTKEAVQGVIYILPSFVLILIFCIIPIFMSGYFSFTEYNIMNSPKFVGLDNYIKMFKDSYVTDAAKNTLLYVVMTVPVQTILALAFAAFLAAKIQNKKGEFLRSVMFIPVIASAVTAGTVWRNVGYFLVIYYAGIMGIQKDLYEAARVDGATPLQQFTKITLPVLKPITYLVVTLGIIWSFQVFDLAYLMTGGGPGHSSVTLVMGIYNAAFKQYKMGYACAMAMFLLLMIIIINVVEDLFFKEKKEAK